MDPTALIRDYYRSLQHRDRERLNEILASNLTFSTPFGHDDDRDEWLDEIWPDVGERYAVNLEVFGGPTEFMVRYQHAPGGEQAPHLAEFVRLEGGRIVEIEVYFGRAARRW